RPGNNHLVPDDRGSCKGPRQTAAGGGGEHDPQAELEGSRRGSAAHRGSSISAQAASHNVLTVTRRLFRAEATGGQNQKLPLPSSPGKPCQSPGMPSCSSPASSTARTWKQGVIMGTYSPITQGWPYSWMPTRSSWA